MTFRVKFTKYGPLKFIGHLDIMRYFQKAVIRAKLDISYSLGYHPHQIMSFASPLSVGVTSDGEYMEIELNSFESKDSLESRDTLASIDAMITQLNAVMSEGIRITAMTLLDPPPPQTRKMTSMALVGAADYMIAVKDGYEFPYSNDEWQKHFENWFSQETLTISKKTKKAEAEIDLKPFIFVHSFELNDFIDQLPLSAEEKTSSSQSAQVYENGRKLYLQLSAGSLNNIKPELILECFCNFAGIEYNPYSYQIHRMELYSKEKGLQPLWAIK